MNPLLTIIMALACTCSFAAQVTCQDVKFGNANYQQKMDELAKQAHLPENDWSRYHEDLVRYLCSGATKAADGLVDYGYVKPEEAKAIAKVLGKTYVPKPPTPSGIRFATARKKLIEMGACSACADNIALHYSMTTDSQCGKLAKKALDGDADAIKTVVDFPDYCKWKY